MKSILILSDFVGSADVAMAVSRAVLSRMGHRTLCLPTALISNIWSQGTPAQLDTTLYLRSALESWERLGIRPDAVLIGYLANEAQAEFLSGQCARWREAGARILLDPVFADNGRLYRGIGQERLALLQGMLKWADYVLPNATEAAFLTGEPEPLPAAQALLRMGAGTALVTGVPGAGGCSVILAEEERTQVLRYCPVPGSFSGAGDAFAALFTGGILRGDTAAQSAQSAISTVGDWLSRLPAQPEGALVCRWSSFSEARDTKSGAAAPDISRDLTCTVQLSPPDQTGRGRFHLNEALSRRRIDFQAVLSYSRCRKPSEGGFHMKRFFCLLLALALLAAPAAAADDEGEPQRCVSLSLACNPSTGYGWIASSSDESVAVADDLEIVTEAQDPYLVGSPAIHNFRITGVSAGEAYFTFAYQREWESVQPIYYFWLDVSVDEALNVTVKPELILPGSWSYSVDHEDALDIAVPEPDEDGNQHFLLTAKADGFATLLLDNQEAGTTYEYQVMCSGGSVILYAVSLRWADAQAGVPFAPDFLFDTTDFDGNPVTEQLFAGHSLTILNFWEPWCGPCVSEMPDLQRVSQEYADKGVQVIGVFSTPDADADVQAVLDETGVTYPILRYTGEFDFLQTGYVPTTVVIGSAGQVVREPFSGSLSYEEWVALIEELL